MIHPWVGGVKDTEAIIKVSVQKEQEVRLQINVNNNNIEHLKAEPDGHYNRLVHSFNLTELEPDTEYPYTISVGGGDEGSSGQFKTFPQQGTPTGFRFALGSCGNRGGTYSKPDVYRQIIQEDDLLFFLHLGDLHYGDLNKKGKHKRLEKYDWALSQDGFHEMIAQLPIAYIWDDHDFLGFNQGGGEEGLQDYADDALEAYDAYVPHYDFQLPGRGIAQAFEVGEVLFLLTDTRYRKTRPNTTDMIKLFKYKTMLGKAQKSWLKRMLKYGKDHCKLTVWANAIPWIAKRVHLSTGNDTWAGYWHERDSIVEWMKENDIDNVCMVSGDAHMLAIDDGQNSRFADDEGGFPIFQAASLDSGESQKGNLDYTFGSRDENGNVGPGEGIMGSGQYGICTVYYNNDQMRVHWEGKKVGEVDPVIQYDFPSPGTYAGF